MFSTNLGLSVQPALTSILRPPYPFTLVGMMSLQCNVLPCPMMHWSLVKNNGVPKSVIVLGCKRLHKLNGPENRWLPRRALAVYHCMRRILDSRWCTEQCHATLAIASDIDWTIASNRHLPISKHCRTAWITNGSQVSPRQVEPFDCTEPRFCWWMGCAGSCLSPCC